MKQLRIFFRQLKQDRRQQVYLSQADVLRDSYSAMYSLTGIGILCALVVILIVWASIITVEEYAPAQGEIIPLNRIHVVQHLDGGVVEDILVKNGSEVKQGQSLLLLDDTRDSAELKRTQARLLSNIASEYRLTALANNTTFDVDALLKQARRQYSLSSPQLLRSHLEEESALLAAERTAFEDEKSVLQAEINQYHQEAQSVSEQIKKLQAQLRVAEQEQTMYDQLRNSDVVSKREHLKVQRDNLQLQQRLVESKGLYGSTTQKLKETNQRLKKLQSAFQKETLAQLNKTKVSIKELIQAKAKLANKVHHAIITSPTDGQVNSLTLTPGTVISPGEKVLEIVPAKQIMVAEARVASKDIGNIRVGDSVKVKVTSFDFARYGAIEGKLASISAASFTDDASSQAYYKAQIMLDRQYLGLDPSRHRLKPGMLVEADIVTGDKTLIQYLIKPIHRSIHSAFHER